MTYGLAEWGSDYNLVHDNIFYDITAANTMPRGIPANSKYWHNIGWVTSLTGSAVIINGATHVHVTHGMNGTPTKVTVTGSTADTASLYVDGISSTEFVITAPGAVGGNRTVYWNAEV